ncbi:hypothetical protein B4N89_03370 [Embleya scabrispora]|uniref:Uncharacterized protein n=1 Tax=Embleya scabrispora TaxID=159449 RepID=A0A1T3NTI5_9ACTN|nr:hypothetical protein B4N89_03370 [Embleya scabrispora]
MPCGCRPLGAPPPRSRSTRSSGCASRPRACAATPRRWSRCPCCGCCCPRRSTPTRAPWTVRSWRA